MAAIVNATPLIYLAKVGKLNLLKILYGDIITTQEVQTEVLVPSKSEYNALKYAFNTWIKILNTTNTDKIMNLHGIHRGEASIISLALDVKVEKNITLIIDDRIARLVARSFDLKIIGTLGVVLYSADKSIIDKDEAIAVIDQLVQTSFSMSASLYKTIINSINKL